MLWRCRTVFLYSGQFLGQFEDKPYRSGEAVACGKCKNHDLRLCNYNNQDADDQDKRHERFSGKKVKVLEAVIFDVAYHKKGENHDRDEDQEVIEMSDPSELVVDQHPRGYDRRGAGNG